MTVKIFCKDPVKFSKFQELLKELRALETGNDDFTLEIVVNSQESDKQPE